MQELMTSTQPTHAHHWVIDEAEGPTSQGRCINCGAERTFRNYPAEEVLQRARYAA